jgi:hypothetical protein
MRTPRVTVGMMVVLAVLMSARTGSANPLLAGDVFRVTFDVATGLIDNPPVLRTPDGRDWQIPEQADLFSVSMVVQGASGVNTFTAKLYDGDRLLGTQTVSATPPMMGEWANFYFASPTSAIGSFTSPQGLLVQPTIIDFSSFLNGSIDGVLEFTLDAGQIDRPGRYGVFLNLGRAVASNEGYGFRIWPHGETPVPEPASMLLVLTGFGGLCARGRLL